MKYLLILPLVVLIQSCINQPDPQTLVDEAIAAHRSADLKDKSLKFDFRDKSYGMRFVDGAKEYTRQFRDDSLGRVRDVLINSSAFNRYINDTLIDLSDEWKGRFSSSVNSVLYFTQLPYGLNDAAVNKEYLGNAFINHELYHKVRVTFEELNGGEDHEDIFIYWFHDKNKTMDFLAYSYKVNGGGMRFRQAINRRRVEGILFQDYVNYKPLVKVDLESLDQLFETGQLKELSRIKNENIRLN